MVLSHRGWERMFARDPAILGRELLVNGLTFQIIGVMPEGFRGLTVGAPDYWAPLSLLGQLFPAHRDRPAEAGVGIIGRLRPGLTPQQARAELAAWDAAQPTRGPNERGVSDVVLTPRRGTVPQPLEAVIVTAPLFFAFGLILLIGCANVTNLLLARGVARQREIGIRLSIGATRRRIVLPVADREPAAGAGGRSGRVRHLTRRARGHHQRRDDQHADRHRRRAPECAGRRLAGAAVPARRGRRVHGVLRSHAGPAGHADRTGPDDTRRSGQGHRARARAQFPHRPPGECFGTPADLRVGVPAEYVHRGE